MPYIDPAKNCMGGCVVHNRQIAPETVRQIGEGTLDIQTPEIMPSQHPQFMAIGAAPASGPIKFTILGGTENTTAILYDENNDTYNG